MSPSQPGAADAAGPASPDVPSADAAMTDLMEISADVSPDQKPLAQWTWRISSAGPVRWSGGAAPFNPPVLGYNEASGHLLLLSFSLTSEPSGGQSRCTSGSQAFDLDPSSETWAPVGNYSPPTVAAFGWAPDPAGGRLFFAGGVGCTSGSSFIVANVLAFTMAGRTGQPATGAWSTGPGIGPRTGAGIAYDSLRDVLVVFGGIDQVKGAVTDVWELRPAGGVTVHSPLPGAPWPSGRAAITMVFDVHRARTLMLSDGQNEVWDWDGTTSSWTARSGGPFPRYGFAVAYDSIRGRVMLFGGSSSAGIPQNDLWEWDGEAGTWTDLTPSPLPVDWPAPRAQHAAAFDSHRNRFVIYGGKQTDPAISSEIWEWGP
jgi:hypothetical protein